MSYLRYCSMVLLSYFCMVSIASPDLLDENTQIVGLQTVINRIMEVSQIPAYIPSDYSHTTQTYAAYLVAAEKQGYEVSIDQNDECRGAHYCQIAVFKAEVGGLPTIQYDMQNKEMTTPVILNNHIKAYFTRGYALGSYTPATLVWRCRQALYSISWNEPKQDTQAVLIQMANSALQGAQCKTVVKQAG